MKVRGGGSVTVRVPPSTPTTLTVTLSLTTPHAPALLTYSASISITVTVCALRHQNVPRMPIRAVPIASLLRTLFSVALELCALPMSLASAQDERR